MNQVKERIWNKGDKSKGKCVHYTLITQEFASNAENIMVDLQIRKK